MVWFEAEKEPKELNSCTDTLFSLAVGSWACPLTFPGLNFPVFQYEELAKIPSKVTLSLHSVNVSLGLEGSQAHPQGIIHEWRALKPHSGSADLLVRSIYCGRDK